MEWIVMAVAFLGGCLGGLFNGITADKPMFKYMDDKCKTMFAGLVGNVLLGGVAAVVFWGLYGPAAGAVIIGSAAPAGSGVALTIGELASSIVIGIGGTGFLKAEASRRCAERTLKVAKEPT